MPWEKKTIGADGSVVVDDDDNSTRSRFCPRNIDTFGFNLDQKQFMITLLLASIMLGKNGTLAFIIALGAYTAFQRFTSRESNGGRGRGNSVGRGPTIKGIKDLPKPPQGG
uniref:Uncharacterized protein n=1 Tax=Helicotheca tamesis TaxID=374047 RepID=A0A7S2H0D0_9STRA|mmetsp:Transcript_13962/g.19109  ORF Transcript_13962/g.19109 Transcript_13962/m.19109 type:complete len:111 (+) Transcript_13962:220-552(+)|eukprot:CAMPEP_0185730198 /NCGR_PEP_ID=MMETSP1171-20130828/8861_1 /TAXON_ID=374046 /ORGANISM="Helicotheca tamensis, Strain CCMP826" /LENGTH=110 /DNA_ID=CAMNT_0028399199 /DNA_START=176 /DNA_END=508 /DNA_ORIENTATION=-